MSRARAPKGTQANTNIGRRDPLASLKMADMMIAKPHLPLGEYGQRVLASC